MKQKIIKYLRILFPFAFTIALWRLSYPWINPAGILAIIPIYYCSFIKPVNYFALFAILMCMMIDYKFNTVMFWTLFYCAYYVIMNLQNRLDLTHTKESGVYAFMLFFGISIFIVTMWNITWLNLFIGILTFVITCAIYIPSVITIRTICHDD